MDEMVVPQNSEKRIRSGRLFQGMLSIIIQSDVKRKEKYGENAGKMYEICPFHVKNHHKNMERRWGICYIRR